MKTQMVKNLFNEKFYKPTYQDWRIDEVKAGKDIVGARYEEFRESYYENMGFEIGNGNKIFGSSYNCDTVVMKDGEIVILEEDKGHFVDSCFLGRALANCAEVMYQVIEMDIKAPYFVLSCPTKMNNYKEITNIQRRHTRTHQREIRISTIMSSRKNTKTKVFLIRRELF